MIIKNIKKNVVVEACIWLGLVATTFLLLLSIMPPMFALLRAITLILLAVCLHYCNTYIFNRFIKSNRPDKYFIASVILIIAAVFIRILFEAHVFPPQIQPAYFQVRQMRPFLYILSTIVTYFISVIVLSGFYLADREKKLLHIANTQTEARLQYLQSQINPHFLFNALNNIYSLVITKSEKAPETLLMLTELLRYAVYQKPLEKVQLYDEVRKIELLISLFNLKNDVPYNIIFDKHNVKGTIEPMILLPLAENCLKHCDFDMNDMAYVIMKIESDENGLKFLTQNTFSDTRLKLAGGVGLTNIRERLELTYPGSHNFSITSKEGIFRVNLDIAWKAK